MKLSTKLIFILILTALFIAASTLLYFSYESAQKAKADALRQKQNVEVLNKNFKSYKNAHGQSVAQVEALNYTVSELKTNEADLYKKLKANKIKPKQVQSIAQVGTASHIEFKTEIQYIDTTKCFAYENEFYTVNGCFTSDSAAVVVETRDSLDIIPVIIPKKFLFIKYGIKGVELTVINSNPFSKLTYLKYIEMNK